MKSKLCVLVSSFLSVFLFVAPNAKAQGNQIILPAGTLIHCTLDEPNFSSKTAEVGDPVVCPLGGIILFNRSVFPRGAYLGGHLEAAKDPGHFFGKGYLQLEFDKLGLPNDQVPLPTKVIAASGYKVDNQGKIDGRGHATRDTIEWMLPPLWPYKVLTLPERGPRPVLKGEERLTLRLMDDVAIPQQPMPGWRFFGEPSSQDLPGNYSAPSGYATRRYSASAAAVVPAALHGSAQSVAVRRQAAFSPAPAATGTGCVVVLRDGTILLATSVSVDGQQLSYKLANGSSGGTSLNGVDWDQTYQRNAENGTSLALNSPVRGN